MFWTGSEKGLECRTTGTLRSAISAFHDPIETIRVGSHPRASALMSGMFNKRLPQPKYPFIWDVETVLDFLRELPGNDLLSDKLLTPKVSMLLSLLSASRVSEITNLRVDYLTKHSSVYTFAIPHLTKTCRRGKKPHPNLKFYNFPGDSKLGVCKAIDSYLERRNVWGFEESQLLVSHIKPHKPVSPSTVSRWLGQVLAMAGINTSLVKLWLHFGRFAPSYNFQAIQRLRNTRVVTAKVCNRRDVIAVLRNKKKHRELSQEGKKNSRAKKFTLMNICVLPTSVFWVNATLYSRKNMLMYFRQSMEKLNWNIDAETGKKPLK